MAILSKSRVLVARNPFKTKSITNYGFLSQEPEIIEESTPQPSTPLPPNPASGSPLYNENWRNPFPSSTHARSLIPVGLLHQPLPIRLQALSQTMDAQSLMNEFSDWTTSQRWPDMKQLFEFWIKSLDKNGKPNKPDVNLYNHYLRANLMLGASPGELLDLVAQMEDYEILPNTASFNLILKAMYQAEEVVAAERLLERLVANTGKESMPDDESYDLVVGLLFQKDQIDSALKHLDMALKSGYMLSPKVFTECVRSCSIKGRLDTLVSIIERCKTMDQNKALCPSWFLSIYIVDVSLMQDNVKLAFYGLEFAARLIAKGENSRPPVFHSVDEGLVISALGSAGRTYNSTLLSASWDILQRSLRKKKVPNPETYLGKINALASLGNLQRAFHTLNEFEGAYGDVAHELGDDMFSPFSSLHPLVSACSNKGFKSLDSVYYQLENLSRGDPPYKSVIALNCVILGCANIWDLDRAYQTFDAISSTFGLSPDIHSYNALICAFGKLKKTQDAVSVFDHMVSKGVKPNATSYSLLIDAHLTNRDHKAAMSMVDDMVKAGWTPSRETLKKIRRRSVRELDYDNNDRVDAMARTLGIRMGSDNRRNMLFSLDYSSGYP